MIIESIYLADLAMCVFISDIHIKEEMCISIHGLNFVIVLFAILRCLRAVCDSWSFFVEFSWDEEVKNYRYSKKRKVFVDVLDFEGGEISVKRENDDNPLSLPKRCMTEDVYTSRQHRTTRLSFEDAMECLLSLKNSLLNLHRKKLFPYNPDVLLRRYVKIFSHWFL